MCFPREDILAQVAHQVHTLRSLMIFLCICVRSLHYLEAASRIELGSEKEERPAGGGEGLRPWKGSVSPQALKWLPISVCFESSRRDRKGICSITEGWTDQGKTQNSPGSLSGAEVILLVSFQYTVGFFSWLGQTHSYYPFICIALPGLTLRMRTFAKAASTCCRNCPGCKCCRCAGALEVSALPRHPLQPGIPGLAWLDMLHLLCVCPCV